MDRIKSFTINHDVLVPGFYISREDGDVITYDLRTRKPNAGDYMDNATMHSCGRLYGQCNDAFLRAYVCHIYPKFRDER